MKTLYSPESQKISQWLRKQRESKGLTMRQAGELLGKPHSFVGKTEVGQRRIDVVEFVWYCRCLGFDPVEGLEEIISITENTKDI
jgi:transcriptional regulator with XRE-family HTH domain